MLMAFLRQRLDSSRGQPAFDGAGLASTGTIADAAPCSVPFNAVSSKPLTFPYKLRVMLDAADRDPIMGSIVSWNPKGTGFIVWKPMEFAAQVLPYYFRTDKFASF
jgi:hypothetical protein